MTAVNPLHIEIASLRAQVDELTKELIRYKQAPGGRVDELDSLFANFNLPYTQVAILLVLSEGGIFSREMLIKRVCRSPEITPKTIDVHICRLRRAIAPLEIKTVKKRGYSLEGESLAAVLDVIKGAA